jgi:8-oxo-dGTP pyrophosphatase MutT (NUDIX family)
MTVPIPQDNRAPRFPVSIKGVVRIGERFVLLKNERDEWELPGGKLENGEDPTACLAREIAEELSLDVSVADLLDCWLYRIHPGVEVVIVTYGTLYRHEARPQVSSEHKEVGLFTIEQLDALRIPAGYAASIRRWHALENRNSS